MKYKVIAMIADDDFNGQESEIMGYMVIDELGEIHTGVLNKIATLYRQGKIDGATFDNKGEVELKGIDNSLLPIFNSCLFSSVNSGVTIFTIMAKQGNKYKIADGVVGYIVSEEELIFAIRNGKYKLGNAVIHNGKIMFNNSFVVLGRVKDKGSDVVSILLPNGKTQLYTEREVRDKLINKLGLQMFNAKFVGDTIVAKYGNLPTIKLRISDKKNTDDNTNKPEIKHETEPKKNTDDTINKPEIKHEKKPERKPELEIDDRGHYAWVINKVIFPKASTTTSNSFVGPLQFDWNNNEKRICRIKENVFKGYRKLILPFNDFINLRRICQGAFIGTRFADGHTIVHLNENLDYLSIEDKAFYKSNITGLKLPANCTIGILAFGYTKLQSIIIPKDAKLGVFAFKNNTDLSEVRIMGTKYIPKKCFQSCSMKNLVIEEGTVCIADRAFGDCYFLTEVTLPKSLQYVHPYAFSYCKSLKKIKVPSHLRGCFDSTKNFGNVEIEYYDSGLKLLDEKVEEPGLSCYSNSYGSTKFYVKNKIITKTLCEPQELICAFPDGIEGIHHPLGHNMLTGRRVVCDLPDTLTYIRTGVFNGVEFDTLKIPASMTYITYGAFRGACIGTLIIPSTVKVIGEKAFQGATIGRIEIEEGLEVIEDRAFADVIPNSSFLKIRVPDSCQYCAGTAFLINSKYIKNYTVSLPAHLRTPDEQVEWVQNYTTYHGCKNYVRRGSYTGNGVDNTSICNKYVAPIYNSTQGRLIYNDICEFEEPIKLTITILNELIDSRGRVVGYHIKMPDGVTKKLRKEDLFRFEVDKNVHINWGDIKH